MQKQIKEFARELADHYPDAVIKVEHTGGNVYACVVEIPYGSLVIGCEGFYSIGCYPGDAWQTGGEPEKEVERPTKIAALLTVGYVLTPHRGDAASLEAAP